MAVDCEDGRQHRCIGMMGTSFHASFKPELKAVNYSCLFVSIRGWHLGKDSAFTCSNPR
jgi:hypothetical protein